MTPTMLMLLTRRLQDICGVVHPSTGMLEVYGHEIRNLLLVAATEVEMHWRGILVANGIIKERYSTNHYVKLAAPLFLRGYRVGFRRYPDIPPREPFAPWDKANPTTSLPWYDAYHQVKHDRENKFPAATLGSAFDAVSACVALILAQYGWRVVPQDIYEFMEIQGPMLPIGTTYVSPDQDTPWTPVPHPALL